MNHIKIIKYTSIITIIFSLTSCTDYLIGNQGEIDEAVYLKYKTKTELELPFENEWYIGAGGKSIVKNHHFAPLRHQRYAMDIIQLVNGVSFSGDGTKNEDHYCFGKRLNAPGNGTIIALENTIKDNIPGVLNTDQSLGNYIIIDHLNGEFSFMVHFKQHSITVSIGDTVVKGQEVGKAGNSGNSTGPHLHYHLQTTADINNGMGLPTQFNNYYADDVLLVRSEPIQGQIVKKN